MWSEARQESPLIGLKQAQKSVAAAQTQAFGLVERPFFEMVNVRGEIDDPAFARVLRETAGVAPPVAPNTVAHGERYSLLWLGPDEWLLKSAAPCRPVMEATLRPLLAGQYASVVDVSSGYTVLEFSGTRVRDVLQKGCPLDLHPRQFRVGQCAQSHFFKADVLLWPLDAGTWAVTVRRSFADYAGRMLLDAAEEFLA